MNVMSNPQGRTHISCISLVTACEAANRIDLTELPQNGENRPGLETIRCDECHNVVISHTILIKYSKDTLKSAFRFCKQLLRYLLLLMKRILRGVQTWNIQAVVNKQNMQC